MAPHALSTPSAEQSRAERSGAEHSRAESSKAELSGAEQSRVNIRLSQKVGYPDVIQKLNHVKLVDSFGFTCKQKARAPRFTRVSRAPRRRASKTCRDGGDADLHVNRGHEHLDLHMFEGSKDVPRWWER